MRLEAALQPLIRNSYYYDKDGDGAWRVNVFFNNAVHSVLVDDGSIMGGTTVSVMGTYHDPKSGWINTLFVPVIRYKEIATDILNKLFFVIPDRVADEIFKQQFNNGLIYRFIDFSGTAFMDQLADRSTFEWRLGKCLKVMKLYGMNMRFRFSNFITPSDFTLTADSQCVSPLQNIEATAPINFNTPIILQFNGNKIIKEIGLEKQIIDIDFNS